MKRLYRVTGDYGIDVMVLSSEPKEIIKREILREVLSYDMPQDMLYNKDNLKQETAYHSLAIVERKLIRI